MKLILNILFASFILLISQSNSDGQTPKPKTPATKPAKSKKGGKKKAGGEKELDAYFYGGKKGKNGKLSKKDKKEKNDKSVKTDGKVMDVKTLLKDKINAKGNKTTGGSMSQEQTNYRPIYVGDKLVTGTISNVQGFRICIYTGTNRKDAMDAKLKFMKDYNNLRSYMSYNSPSYKIKVGDYVDKKVAQKALKSIVVKYPSSFIVPDVVTKKNIMIYKNY